MDNKTKSLIRHILTAVGTIITLLGVNSVVPIITFIQNNLDGVWEAASTVIGALITIYGYFFKRD